MSTLKIAVLGASKIGAFHVREFLRAGAEIAAILGSSEQTAVTTSRNLAAQFGVAPRPYFELSRLLASGRLDAVSVCTPPDLHAAQVRECLQAGLHVLCEKPFVADSNSSNAPIANELVALAEKMKRIIAVNTQWPSILESVAQHVNLRPLLSFSSYMQPGVSGMPMLTEQLSHPASILARLIPGGQAKQIAISEESLEYISVEFRYENKDTVCAVRNEFHYATARPRAVEFSFNGYRFKRVIDKEYQQKFVTQDGEFDIADPFSVSIGKFVRAITVGTEPLVTPKEIVENMALQDALIAAYQHSRAE